MKARVRKWGNSLALRIPRAVAAETGLAEDAEVELSVEAGKLVVTPLARPKYTLDELVGRITAANRHGEVDFGPPVGGEAG
jgi:antitoxin MazE